MAQLQRIGIQQTAALAAQALGAPGCLERGIVVLRGADSWQAHERGYIELPASAGTMMLPLAYDEREAPYPLGTDGKEDTGLLLSLSDEDDCIACAWARTAPGSALLGVGIDLSATHHFEGRARKRDLSRLLLTEHERSLVPRLEPDDPLLAKAALFAAKEAAFKATAAPLRRWYEKHSDPLRYEVRHFVMEEPGIERGTGRNGAAQTALDRMGIARVAVHYVRVADMALVVALALARERG